MKNQSNGTGRRSASPPHGVVGAGTEPRGVVVKAATQDGRRVHEHPPGHIGLRVVEPHRLRDGEHTRNQKQSSPHQNPMDQIIKSNQTNPNARVCFFSQTNSKRRRARPARRRSDRSERVIALLQLTLSQEETSRRSLCLENRRLETPSAAAASDGDADRRIAGGSGAHAGGDDLARVGRIRCEVSWWGRGGEEEVFEIWSGGDLAGRGFIRRSFWKGRLV